MIYKLRQIWRARTVRGVVRYFNEISGIGIITPQDGGPCIVFETSPISSLHLYDGDERGALIALPPCSAANDELAQDDLVDFKLREDPWSGNVRAVDIHLIAHREVPDRDPEYSAEKLKYCTVTAKNTPPRSDRSPA